MRKLSFYHGFLLIILLFNLSDAGAQVNKKNFAGSWLGNLEVGALNLRLVFNLTLHDNDSLSATLDSPDQGAKNIPLGKVILTADSLRIEAPLLGARYDGRIVSDTEINGLWQQSGQKFTANLKKLPARFTLNRPQEPKPPFPYIREEVSIPNKKFNIYLSGTLTIPDGEGPFPAVILITGSGAQNRDEELMGHKPFLVIADYLTRHGIAVLRYDDRGVGKSQGNYAVATTADLATDAEAAFGFLLNHKAIDKTKIGLAGHSEGGLISCITASSNPGIAFVISLAGQGVTGEEILYRQQADIGRASGMSEARLKETHDINKKLYSILKKEKDNLKAEKKIMDTYLDILKKKKLTQSEINNSMAELKGSFNASVYPWFRYFLTADPATFWRNVKCPVLALNGEKDLQVAAEVNLPAIEKAVKAGGNKNVTVKSFPGLNHLFQHCSTGLPAEYGQTEETISEEVLETITAWIKSLK